MPQRGPVPPTFQSVGLEEALSPSHGWQCPLCLVRLVLKPAQAFEASLRVEPFTKHSQDMTTHDVIEVLRAAK